jgi:hypothetical protein
MAPLVTLLAGRLLFRFKSFGWVAGVTLALTTVVLFTSNTRTAALAVVLGLLSAMFLGILRERAGRKEAIKSWGVAIVIGILMLAMVLSISGLRDATVEFIFKRGDGDTVEEAFMASRGDGVELQWLRFLEKPLTGHGFGIYPGGQMSSKPATFMGLPISAPVEKGFLRGRRGWYNGLLALRCGLGTPSVSVSGPGMDRCFNDLFVREFGRSCFLFDGRYWLDILALDGASNSGHCPTEKRKMIKFKGDCSAIPSRHLPPWSPTPGGGGFGSGWRE